jgi:pyruvate formate lyase activating enzyme
MNGTIFNIQKFSIHDGPGIRTTVFFKGCPLRCKWCANPESQSLSIQILHNEERCTHCLQCVHECPHHAIDEGLHIDESKCTSCLHCVEVCPNKALTRTGEKKSIDEIVSLCLQDKDFYLESNGGVTISGGEGLFQSSFVKHLVNELHKHHLHVAIETTGFINDIVFHELAPLFDLLLFDVKHYDSNKHKEGTGVGNSVIIRNLKWAKEKGIPLLVRIPVIPFFNDTLDDAYGFSHLFNELDIKEVQLLPFHQMGEKKYSLLKRHYVYKNIPPLHKEELTDYQNIFISQDIHCFF